MKFLSKLFTAAKGAAMPAGFGGLGGLVQHYRRQYERVDELVEERREKFYDMGAWEVAEPPDGARLDE